MPQRTINLYDGLEALYYFDSDYTDFGANELKDKSGYGRHAEATGGPTFDVEGPDDFEAVALDGTDDFFDSDFGFDSAPTEATIFTLVKPTNLDRNTQNIFNNLQQGRSQGFGLVVSNGNELMAEVGTTDGSREQARFSNFTEDTFFSAVARLENGTLRLFVDGESVADTTFSDIDNDPTNTFHIAANGTGSADFEGEVAAAALWSRALSDAEIGQLNRLTAPRRGML